MKNYKIYRVINDTHNSHGMVNNYAKLHGEVANDHLWLKETKTCLRLFPLPQKRCSRGNSRIYHKEIRASCFIYRWTYCIGYFSCKCDKRWTLVRFGSICHYRLRLLYYL